MIGVYPGSFDPFTVGHMDVLRRAARILDKVVVAVLVNGQKSPAFSMEERKQFIGCAIRQLGLTNVEAASFDGLLVDYVRSVGAQCIVRGLRAVTDFEYEFTIDAMNRRLAPEVDTFYVMANPEHSFLSSGIVREVASYGGSIAGLVPQEAESIIAERLLQR